jgi:autotransporter family porin
VAVRSLDTTGQYLPLGNPNNAMALNGPVQGHLLGVSSFSNAGLIDLTANPHVGDVLVISGGRTAGVDGGGVFVANGGSLKLNSVLNAGGNAGRSQSDMLVLDSTRLGSAPTGISISNIGGQGATPTLGNGIALVEVLNKQASAPGVFTLSTAAVAGVHEYLLYQGGNERTGGNPADGNWYLRSEIAVPPTPPSPPDPTPPVPSFHPLFRPEVGAYLSNRRQASGMFLHSLHDRLGEPQYDQEPGADEPEKKRKSAWLRIVGKSTHARTSDSVFQVKSDSTLIQGGGDFVRWATGEDDESRAYLGGMLAYGQARSDATAEYNQRKAHSEVDGWSLGLYGTWFQNDATKLGAYVDVWGQLGLFNSSMEGERLPEVNYNGRSINLSGEVGYAMRVLSSEWIVEPQAQLVYVKYNEDEITEPNGTRIAGSNDSAWVSRLGLRTYGTWIHNGRKLQPFLTLNWWHDTADNALAFNSVTVEDVYPNNRYEVKLGLHADFSKGWTGWGNVGYLWGKQDFKTTSLRLGVKYMW